MLPRPFLSFMMLNPQPCNVWLGPSSQFIASSLSANSTMPRFWGAFGSKFPVGCTSYQKLFFASKFSGKIKFPLGIMAPGRATIVLKADFLALGAPYDLNSLISSYLRSRYSGGHYLDDYHINVLQPRTSVVIDRRWSPSRSLLIENNHLLICQKRHQSALCNFKKVWLFKYSKLLSGVSSR